MTRRMRRAGAPLTVGTVVEWQSQSRGHTTIKRGTVIAVVPAGIEPHRCMPAEYRPVDGAGFGAHRDHESYLVVNNAQTRKKAHWPRVHALRAVERK